MFSLSPPVYETEFSDTMRRYLAEIYHLGQDETWVKLTMLAARINVTTPATTRMIKSLAKRGLVEYQHYKGVRLMALGRQIALSDIRCYRLVERFLVDTLGFGWHEAHLLARQANKSMPQIVAERLELLLGYPKICPYGEPIPTCDGEMPRLNDSPLTELVIGATGHISRIKVRDPEQLCYLAELGLVPGASFELLNRLPFNGPVQLKVGNCEHMIGFDLATSLWGFCSINQVIYP